MDVYPRIAHNYTVAYFILIGIPQRIERFFTACVSRNTRSLAGFFKGAFAVHDSITRFYTDIYLPAAYYTDLYGFYHPITRK